jgi:hypothetical protein
MPDSPKHHPIPLSGGDRKALTKELGKSQATGLLRSFKAGLPHQRCLPIARKVDPVDSRI